MTGLIYVAIIAVWAVVLVPAWLRRHDHQDPERSVDRFTRSMQTLGHRPSVLGIPMPTHDERPESGDQPGDRARPRRSWRKRAGKQGDAPNRAGRTPSKPGPSRSRRPSAAARRRVVLAVLLIALVVVAGLVGAGVLLPVALAVPLILISGFLALARQQVRVARRTSARRAAVRTARSARAAATSAPTPATSASTGSTWEARSTPLPTYVTAPTADGHPRTFDTQIPGAWTAAAMLERAQKQKVRAERMAAAKAEAVARARAEQEASQVPTRDDEFLAGQAAAQSQHDTMPLRRVRAVNE